MRTKQRNNLAETARHERVAQNTDVYAVKARNYKGLRRGSPVLCRADERTRPRVARRAHGAVSRRGQKRRAQHPVFDAYHVRSRKVRLAHHDDQGRADPVQRHARRVSRALSRAVRRRADVARGHSCARGKEKL